MSRIVLGLAAVLSLFSAVQADAATVYFRGEMLNPGANDPLGLNALPDRKFEVLVNTNNGGGVLGNYIVFNGISFTFTTGTFASAGGDNIFSGMTLVGAPAGTSLTITIPGGAVTDSQAGLDSLIGRVGGIAQISHANGAYVGGITAVPEPTSMMALTGLVVGCGAFARRRRAA